MFKHKNKVMLFGRKKIDSPETVVNKNNVVEVLTKALPIHRSNSEDIDYLYSYYKGRQPVINREKSVREDILNKIIENHALEIIDFKKGYGFTEPIQYVRRSEREGLSELVRDLNEYMHVAEKSKCDKELAEWFLIAGTAYRMILPTENFEIPFEIDVLDPRSTFVVYNTGFGKKPIMAVTYVENKDGDIIYSVYTKDRYFEIISEKITKEAPHVLGEIPIIEYPANTARLGAFEPALPLLDLLNEVVSNRIDGVEQFIQAFMKFINCNIETKDVELLREWGAIRITGEPGLPADVDLVARELNQQQTQILKDDIYQMILIIVGIPNNTGGASLGKDTGQAVLLRDGWMAAETRQKDIELMFKASDKKFLTVVLKIMRDTLEQGFDLKLKDVDIKFTRNRSDNLLVKSQGLQNMLEAGIHPRIAIKQSELFGDPEEVYLESEEYMKKWLDKELEITPLNNKPFPKEDL